MSEDADQAIWITLEAPVDPDEYEAVIEQLEDTGLDDRYQIIVTDDRIDTIDMDELREAIDA